jgi:hypothetical protein
LVHVIVRNIGQRASESCNAANFDYAASGSYIINSLFQAHAAFEILHPQSAFLTTTTTLGHFPMSTRHVRLLILGSGPAGYSAAVYAARANLNPVLITGMAQGGQLMTTTDVDNWPADADGVQGPDLMARFEKHAARFNTEMIFDHIHTAKLTEKPIRLVGDSRRIHMRRADHRHRCIRAISRFAFRRSLCWQGRFCLRDLRWLLL